MTTTSGPEPSMPASSTPTPTSGSPSGSLEPPEWPLDNDLIPADVASPDVKKLMQKLLVLAYDVAAVSDPATVSNREFTERERFIMDYVEIVSNAFEVMLKKNAAYARSEPLGNLNLVERLTGGYVPTSLGIATRAGDKLTRMANHSISLASGTRSAVEAVESISNDPIDLINYSVLYSYALRKEANGRS